MHLHAHGHDAGELDLPRHRAFRPGLPEERALPRAVLLQGTSLSASHPSHGHNANPFLQADTTGFKNDPDNVLDHLPKGVTPNNDLVKAIQGAASAGNMRDIYQVGLWNYCEADLKDGKAENWHCTDRQNYFWFNPFAVWKLENTTVQAAFPDTFKNGIDAYEKVSKWMFVSYMVALVLTVAEVLIGISAIFSRWGSLITTIVSTVRSSPSYPAHSHTRETTC